MAREGSIRRDLRGIVEGLRGSGASLDRLVFCSDGVDPADLTRHGHMDHCVREAVAAGIEPARAIAMSSRACFDYYGMSRDLGGVAPGRLADMVVLDDLEKFAVSDVFVGGRQVVGSGRLLAAGGGAGAGSGRGRGARPPAGGRARRPRAWTRRTVMLRRLVPGDFAVRPRGPRSARPRRVAVNTIDLATEIITRRGTAELEARDGSVRASPDADVWKAAAFDRVRGSGRGTVAFLRGFGAPGIGAFASTWSFHENDLVVIGQDDDSMAAAANAAASPRRGAGAGGMAVVSAGAPGPSEPSRASAAGPTTGSGSGRRSILALMPLGFAGIASTAPFDEAAGQLEAVNSAIADAGCPLARPHLVPLFLPFLALPAVRLLHAGMVDIRSRTLLPALAENERSEC